MTLVETMTTVGVVGIMVGALIRPWSAEADRARVTAAQGQALNAYRQAQSWATVLGRTVVVTIATDSVVVTTGPADSAVLLRSPGPGAFGVVLTPARHVAAFAPSGMAAGAANVTQVFSRGSVQRQLVMSRLGRIRVN